MPPPKRIIPYAQPRPREPRVYAGISRKLLFINCVSLAAGVWVYSGSRWQWEFLAIPLYIAIIAMQFFASLLPTLSHTMGLSRVPWWEWVLLYGSALGGMVYSIGSFFVR